MLIRNMRDTVGAALGLIGKAATATYYVLYSAVFIKEKVAPEVEKPINPPVKRKPGRPRKRPTAETGLPKRKPGRPRKNTPDITQGDLNG